MISWRHIIVALVAVAVLGGGYFWVQSPKNAEVAPHFEWAIHAKNIREIVIPSYSNQAGFSLVKEKRGWKIVSPMAERPAKEELDLLLSTLENLVPIELLGRVTQNQLAVYGISENAPIRIKTKGFRTHYTYLCVGNFTPSKHAHYAWDPEAKQMILISNQDAAILRKGFAWIRSKSLFEYDEKSVQSVFIESDDVDAHLTKSVLGRWLLYDSGTTVVANQKKVAQCLFELSLMKAKMVQDRAISSESNTKVVLLFDDKPTLNIRFDFGDASRILAGVVGQKIHGVYTPQDYLHFIQNPKSGLTSVYPMGVDGALVERIFIETPEYDVLFEKDRKSKWRKPDSDEEYSLHTQLFLDELAGLEATVLTDDIPDKMAPLYTCQIGAKEGELKLSFFSTPSANFVKVSDASVWYQVITNLDHLTDMIFRLYNI